MQQIINFLIRNKTLFLFLLLFGLSLLFTIQSHSYHRSRFVNSANFLSGGIYSKSSSIGDYFNLKDENIKLQEENKYLRSLLLNTEEKLPKPFIDSSSYQANYVVTPAIVYKNSYNRANNVILINKGKEDSISQDLGVISSKGIVGITDASSGSYTTVLSLLNTDVFISAKLKKSDHFGSLNWDTETPNEVLLTQIPKFAPVKIGDTIVTSGRSSIFPKDILIGTIKDFQLDQGENFYSLRVKLFNDMTSLNHVYVIKNNDKKKIDNLLNSEDE